MPLTVRYGPVLQGLLDAFGLEGGTKAGEAFQARIKNLKRIGFPPAVQREGTGRVDYGLDDVIALIIALRLVAAYVPPATAARLAIAGSDRCRQSAADGLSIDVVKSSHAKAARSLLLFSPNALDELGNRESRAGRYEPPVRQADLLFLSLGGGGFGEAKEGNPSMHAEIATAKSIDGVSLDGITTGAMLAHVLRFGNIDGRSAIAELSAVGKTAAPPYEDAHGEDAFRWHARRLVGTLRDRNGDALSLTHGAIDLRLVLAPADRQKRMAHQTLWSVPNDYSPSLADALLAAVRLAGMPIAGIGDGCPATISLIVRGCVGGPQPDAALLDVITSALADPS